MRAVANPPNPWHRFDVEWLGPPPTAALEVYEECAKSIVTENKSPDVGFRFGVNPYRGCFHGCSYCYARPSHQYLDFGAGTDFERRIVAKVNAAELLRARLLRRSWRGAPIVFSGNTDCYQPLEAHYQLTRRMLEVCLEFRNPVGIITKSALVRRDAELLGTLAAQANARVYMSIPFVDGAMARAVEPHAPTPAARFDAMRVLADAGVPVGVALAPIIPGLNEDQIPAVMEQAADAGATHYFSVLLRLPRETGPVFWSRLRESFPQRVRRVENALRDCHGGRVGFFERMRGRGPRWQSIQRLIELQARRFHLSPSANAGSAHERATFRRPQPQLEFFGRAADENQNEKRAPP